MVPAAEYGDVSGGGGKIWLDDLRQSSHFSLALARALSRSLSRSLSLSLSLSPCKPVLVVCVCAQTRAHEDD